MRDPFDIYPETTPADALDAFLYILGEEGAPRSINDLAFVGEGVLFGRAVTLRSLPARPDHNETIARYNSKQYGTSAYAHAMSLCDEKSVLVIEARGTLHYATGGGTGLAGLAGQRAAGLLTDGQIRDRDSLERYAAETGTRFATGGFTIQYGTGRMLMPAEVNIPVAIRDTLVVPGDYIFGNRDGVLVIPAALAEEILETAVVLNRMAAVLEDAQLETRTIMGRDLALPREKVIAAMTERFAFSARQRELLDKYVKEII